MNDEYINELINDEINFSNKLSSTYNYPDNITHLLYLIIPAFIIKYGLKNRKLIEECFMNVPIRIDDKQDKVYQAYYYSIPKYRDNDIITIKSITLNNYNNISLMQLIDNLVHEYNHAVNSLINEVNIIDNKVLVRTGISFNYYNKSDLSFISKSEESILEEVINTRQTESIIETIKDFSNKSIDNSIISNTLYSISDNYTSGGYYLESIVCKQIMENKTFISTFENLRFNGEVSNLHEFFDTVTGKKGSLVELSKLLNQSLKIQHDLPKIKFFKKNKIAKLRDISIKALEIVELFNQNTVYK